MAACYDDDAYNVTAPRVYQGFLAAMKLRSSAAFYVFCLSLQFIETTLNDVKCENLQHIPQRVTRVQVLCTKLSLHMRQTPSKKQADKQTHPLVRCVCRGRPSYGWTKCDASCKFKGKDRIKILDQPINTQNLVS